MLGGVHQIGELGPSHPELTRDMAPCLPGLLAVGLLEGLADGGGGDRVLSLRDMREGVAHPVDAAALPGRLEDAGDRALQAGMGIADHQLHAVGATGAQGAEEVHPEGFRFGGADAQSNDFPAALGVRRHGDYGRDGYDPAALALLEVSGVEPEIGPLAGQGAVEELADPLVDVLAQLRDGALRDPAQSHGLHQVIDAAGGHAADPRLLNDGHQRLFRGLSGFEKAGEVAALPQLRHLQVQRAQSGVERALAIAVAPGRALLGPLVPAGADHALDIGLHHS